MTARFFLPVGVLALATRARAQNLSSFNVMQPYFIVSSAQSRSPDEYICARPVLRLFFAPRASI